MSLFNDTYYNNGGVWGNNITPQRNAVVTYSIKDADGNYLIDTSNNQQIINYTARTDSNGYALIYAKFNQKGIYTLEYTFPPTGNYIAVSGKREFVIQDFVNYTVPDTIYRYYNDYPNLWVNVTNPQHEGLTSPEGYTDYDIAVLTQGVRYYIYNTNTGNYDYYTRPVINGKAVFENITGSYRIPLVNNLNSPVAYPEGYYYAYNISSQFLGNTLYTNSTNKTTVVYVYRNPTSVSIQNTSGVVSGLMGEDIELVANVRDLTGRNMVNGQYVTFVYNNRVLAKAIINSNVARTTVKFNDSIYDGELYAYFNDTLYLTDQTQLCENSSAVVTLNIHKLESKVETQESLEGIYNNKVKIRAIVKDSQGNPITSGVVSFKKGDTILENVTVSGTGVAEYDYTIGTEESVIITSFYNGSANYENNTNTTTVNRITIPTILTIENLPETVKVAESFNFNVKLTNTNNDPLQGQSISVKVNGEPVPVSGTTGSDGMVTVSYTPSSKSDLTIVANYDTDYVYNSNTTSASITSSSVELIDTVMGIIVPDTVSVAQPFTFKVNLTNLTGDAIPDKDVSVSILGDSVSVVYDTNEKLYIGTYTPRDNTNIIISASTTADNVYKAASATNNTLTSDKIGLISTNLSLSFSQNNKALNPITITVTLTNRSGDNVDGLVIISENGQVIGTVDTSSSNQMTYTPSNNTTLKFSAEYRGDNHKYDANKTETYNVPVSVLNTTLIINVPSNGIKVSEQFTFTVSLTNTTGSQPISGKDINVTVNGESVTVAYDSSQNLYVGTYTPANNNNLLFKANFTGDKVYGASYDEDSSITSSDIELIDTVMGIIVPATVNVAEPFTFNVNLTNSSGEAISGQTITVTVNNENVAVTYNSTSGLYDGVYTPKNNDSIIITASSPETTVYKAASAINNTLTSSVIGTIPTIASLTFSSPNATVFVPYTITVNLTNATTDKEVVRGNVKVYINGVLNRTVEIVDRAVSFTIIPQNNTTYEMYAVYDGDGSVYSSNQSATYTIPVNLALTTTKLSVPNTYKVNETFNFTISLTNDTTNLPDKPLIVTINDEQITNVVYDPVSGLYNASYTPANRLYDLDFKAVFEGDTQYNASYDTVSIPRSEIVLINTIIGVISPESVNVSDTLVMKFNITDEYGQKLRASMLDVYIVGEKVTGVVEGDYLVVSYPTTNETVLPVSVEFIDHDGVHHDSSTDFVVHVVKIPTTTCMTIVNNTAGNVIINVSVVGANNVNVTDGNITVLANGHQYDIVALNGQKVVTIPLTELTTYGNFTIYVDYSGNNTYHSSSAVSISPIEILPQIITFNLTANESVYVTEVVNITGQIRDGFNQPIANRNIIVRVFDEEGHVDPETVTTDDNGVYTRLYTTIKIGTFNVTVYYGGQDGIKNTTNKTNFTVKLIPTNTAVGVYNNTAGNFSISVNVTDSREGHSSTSVEKGRLVIVVDDTTTVYHDVTLGENIIKLESITTSASTTIHVTYEANDKYNTSSAEISSVNARIKDTALTISVTPSSEYNNTITLNGTLIDELGNGVASTGKISLVFNGTYTYTNSITTDSEGKFEITFTASEIGNFEVNATFTGIDGEYNSSNTTAIFNVNKIPTDTEVIIDDESASDLRVLFRVYNDTTPVELGFVSLYIGETLINVTDLSASNIEFTHYMGNTYVVKHFTEEYLEEYGITGGVTSIKAVYAENNYYIGSEDTYSGTLLDNALINVKVNSTKIYVDGSVNITVNVTDLEGHPIRGVLTLQINDNITTGIVMDTNDQGIYSIIYSNATAGEYTVTATLNTAIYGTVFNTTSFNITKIPTKTNVSVHNDSWGNASIDVVVYDARTNTTINTGNLHIVIGNAEQTESDKTVNETGVTNIAIPTKYAGEFAVTVTYLENPTYLSSIGLNNKTGEAFVITVVKHNASLTVTTNQQVYSVGQNVTISGYLYDVNTGLAIANQRVQVIVRNATTTLATYNLQTDSNGYYEVNRTTTVAGTFTVNATFEGVTLANELNINGVENSTTYTVNRIPTTTTVQTLNTTYGNITISVNVKGNDGLNITEGTLTIKFGNEEFTTPITGNETIIKLPSLGIDSYNLNVSYPGSTKYVESNNTEDSGVTGISVQKQYATITVIANPTHVIVTDSVKISGYVYDGINNQTNLVNGVVNITFVDENGDVVTESTALTDSYYEFTRQTQYAGLINVTVAYINDTYYNSTAKTSYTVGKIPTNTTISVYNDTFDKVELAVTIVDARNGNPITSGKYNLSVNDNIQSDVSFGQNNRWINSTTFIVAVDTTSRTISVSLNYTGDSIHESSIGKDENGESQIVINSKNQTATLTINVNTTETYVGEKININGTLVDGLNNVINGKINLTFTNGTHTAITEVNVVNGRYSHNRTVNMTGVVNVTASYLGNDTINPANATANYTIDKLPTSITLAVVNNTVGNLTISVQVTENYHNVVLEEGHITIEYGTTIVSDAVLDGAITLFNITSTSQAPITITVNFTENNTHAFSTNTITTSQLERQVGSLTISANDTVQVDQTVTINGTFKDGMGNAALREIIIKVYDPSGVELQEIPTHITDADGKYSVTFVPTRNGTYTTQASYVGGDIVAPVNSEVYSFVVEKIHTITNVTVLNATAGNVTIKVKVTDVKANNITSGRLNVTVDENSEIKEFTNVNEYIIKLDSIVTNGTHSITIEYLGTEDKYYPSRGINSTSQEGEELINIDIELLGSTITLDKDAQKVYVGNNITVYGRLLDSMGKPISNAIVNLTFVDDDGQHTVKAFNLTDSNGYYYYQRTTEYNGTINVTATYYGEENKINSSTANLTYVVEKIDTLTYINLLNNTLGNVTIETWFINQLNVDEYVREGSFDVFINQAETPYVSFDLSTLEPNENGRYTLTLNEEFDVGENTVNVRYNGNYKFKPSQRAYTDRLYKDDIEIDITLDKISTYVNNLVSVNVSMTHNNLPVEGRVNITILNSSGDVVKNISIYEFLNNGNKSFTYTNESSDIYTIKVAFYGTNIYNALNVTKTFTLNKLPTETLVDVLSNVINNVTISVTVNDTENNEIVKTGYLIVTVDGNAHTDNPISVNNSGVTIIKLDTTGVDVLVTVRYVENNMYQSSIGVNASNREEITDIILSKQPTRITVVATPNETYIGTPIIISGNLINPLGDVNNQLIRILINERTYEVRTSDDDTGSYTFTYDSETSINNGNGTFIVNVTYDSNTNTVANDSHNFTIIKINKIPTNSSLSVVNNTVGNITVNVKVINATNGGAVTTGIVEFYAENNELIGSYQITQAENIIKLGNITQSGNIAITAKYIENNIYLGSDVKLDDNSQPLANISVSNQTATINIDVQPTSVIIGESVRINGTLVDGMGENIDGIEIVEIRIDNDVYHVNVTNGKFSLVNITYTQGVKKVNATYIGNDTINSVVSSTKEFTVNLIPTKTFMSTVNDTVGTVVINVNVTNNTGDLVTTGELSVKVGNNESRIVNVNSSGITFISLTEITSMDNVTVTVTYLANEVYNSSKAVDVKSLQQLEPNEYIEINTTKHDSIMDVSVVESPVKVGQNITIRGTLVIDNGTNVDNGTTGDNEIVHIWIGNSNVGSATVKDGKFEFNYTTQVVTDGRTVRVIYDGTELIEGSEATTTYVVEKLPTITIINVLNSTAGNVTLNISVNDSFNNKELTYLDENNNPIGNLTIYVGDVNVMNVTLNTTNIIYLPSLVEPQPNVRVTVFFIPKDETIEYLESNNNTVFTLTSQTANLTIVATPNPASVGDVVTITGRLTDGMKNNISNVELSWTIGTSSDKITTDEHGIYSFTYIPSHEGVYEVNVSYSGGGSVGPIKATSTFTVNKIPTNTTVEVLNSTVGNVTIRVNVTDNQTQPITSGKFNVTVYNSTWTNTSTVDIAGTSTIVNINITIADSDYNVKVVYLGDDKYINSTGKDSKQRDVIPIHTVKQNATLTVSANPTEAYVGRNVDITIRLVDGMGNGISDYVTLNFTSEYGSEIIPNVEVIEGNLVYPRTSHLVGHVNVTVMYAGNGTINPLNASTNYTILKIPTTTTLVRMVNNTIGNLTIELRFTDTHTGNAITSGSNFTVELVGKEELSRVTYNLDEDASDDRFNITSSGTIILKVDETHFGDKEEIGIVTFLGNGTYNSSWTRASEEIEKEPVSIELNINETVYINQTVTFNVTVKDSHGVPFEAVVNITVGGETFRTDETIPESGKTFTFSKELTGDYSVVVTYPGTSLLSNTTANKTVKVDRIPTQTIVTLLNNTYGNVTIKVIVNDTVYDKLLTNGTLIITGGAPCNVTLNGTETIIKLNVTNVRNTNVYVRFNGTDYYQPSYGYDSQTGEQFEVIDVVRQNATLTINVSPNPNHVGNTSIISGKLVDGLGKNITGEVVTILVNNVTYMNEVNLNESGEFSVPFIGNANGTYNITVEFAGNRFVNNITANKTLTLIKILTTTKVTLLNSTAGNVTIRVNVTDEFGKPVTTDTFAVNVTQADGTVSQLTVPITGETTDVLLPNDVSGVFNVNVTYTGTNVYFESNGYDENNEPFTGISVSKQDVNLTVGVIRTEVYVGTNMVIQGELRNASGLPIANVNITLTFDGIDEVNVTTNAAGYYSYTRPTHINGLVTVEAFFAGDDKYNDATADTSYLVHKIPTNTTVGIVNNTVGNVTIDVQVINANDPLVIITSGTINVTVNNVTSLHEITGTVTNIKLDINNCTKANVTVTYLGNDTYANSTGMDRKTLESDNPQEFAEITADKQNATLTIVEGPSPVYVLNNVTYNGTLVDGLGNNITGKINITVMFGDELVERKTVDVINGVYNWTRTSIKVGQLNVTASYLGNDTVNPINASTLYVVNLRPTVTLVNITNNTAGNVTIDVEVRDYNGTTITVGNFTVKVQDHPDKTVVINDAVTPVNLDITSASQYIAVSVIYNGNEIYATSTGIDMDKFLSEPSVNETVTNTTVKYQTPTMTMNPIANSSVGDTIAITGHLEDGMGKNITNRLITVTIGETELSNRTDANGNYTVYYTSTINGTFTAIATYSGNNTVSPMSVETTFNVTKLNTTTIVKVLNKTVGNVTITVNVTDERGNVVDHGEFNITIDENNPTTYTISGDITTVHLDVEENGTISVNVTYLGDNKYKPSKAQTIDEISGELVDFTEITTIKQDVNLTVGVIRHEIPIGTLMVISGYLTNSSGLPIANANITLTFGNVDSVNVTTDSNGHYTFERDTKIAGYVEVEAYYNGSAKYNNQTAYTHYTVNKLPTNTTVRVINNTAGNVLIDIVVYDMYHNGIVISNGTLNVTVDGISTIIPFTTENTTVKLDIQNKIKANVKVEYLGNATYLNSTGITIASWNTDNPTEFTEIEIERQNATLTLLVNETSVTVFDSIKFNGTFINGLGENFNGVVSIKVDNGTDSYIYENVEVIDGYYEQIRTTNITGTINVTVMFAGNNDINPLNASKTYNIDKRDTITLVQVVNDTVGNIVIDVVVKDAVNGEVLTSGENLIAVSITEGIFNYSISESGVTRITVPVSDNRQLVRITVDYLGNGTYNPSLAYDNATYTEDYHETITTITVKTHNSILTIDVTPVNSTVGTVYNISGNFVDINGTAIVGASLKIDINGTIFYFTTVENGYYSINYTSNHEGNYTVNVSYVGDDIINATSNSTTFKVNKIPTNTSVYIVNNTVGNVTLNVTVTDVDGNPINGTLNVTIGTNTKQVTIVDGEIIIDLESIGLGIDTTEEITAKVVFIGNDTYLNSTGIDARTLEDETPSEFNQITADKESAVIGVDVYPLDTTIGNIYSIFGSLNDTNGKAIKYADVNITVRNDSGIVYSVNVTTDRFGEFEYINSTLAAGTYTVNVSYYSNEYNYTSAQKTFRISKINTTTTASVQDFTAGNVTVRVVVTDYTGNKRITEGYVNITDANGNLLARTTLEGTNGIVDVLLESIKTSGDYTFIANYEGSPNYNNSSDDTSMVIVKIVSRNVNITVSPVNSTFANITVKVNLTDATLGNPIVDAKFNITDANGVVVGNGTTGSDGTAIVKVTVPVGEQTLTVVYPGNDTYTANTKDFTIEVIKRESKTNATIINTTAGNVTVRVNVTDAANGSAVTSGNITILANNEEVAHVEYDSESGIVDVKTSITESKEYVIVAIFEGNENYTSSQDDDSDLQVNIGKRNATVIYNEPIVNNTFRNTTINVTVVDEITGDPIINGIVNVTDKEGKLIGNGTTDSEGNVLINLTVPVGSNDINIKYVGNITYNEADIDETINIVQRNSTTVASITNYTAGNVTVRINVTDKVTGEQVTNGTVTITANGQIVGTAELNAENNGVVEIVTSIADAGDYEIVAKFNGNTNYTDSQDNLETQTINKQNATLTLLVNETSITVFDSIKFNGTLIDGLGNNIDAKVNITVTNGTDSYTYVDVNVDDGFYEQIRNTNLTGIINVTVRYGGNNTINPANITRTYDVDKRATITLVQVVNDTIGNLVIDVVVMDAVDESVLLSGENLISVTFDEGTFTESIDASGVTRIVVPISENIQHVGIKVEYLGNGTYKPSTGLDNKTYPDEINELTNIDLNKHNATLSVVVNPVVSRVGTVFNISGNFVDANGTAIVGANLIITVNNTYYNDSVITGENGYYSVNYTSSIEGNYTVTVKFNSNGVINTTVNSTTLRADKVFTNTLVRIVNNTMGNVTIAVNVTEVDGTPITSGTLNITVGDKTKEYTFTEVENIISLKDLGLNIDSTSPVNVKIVYPGTNVYVNSTGKVAASDDEFNVISADKANAVIKVQVEPNAVTINKVYDIIGNLTDINCNNIGNANVNITVKDKNGIVYSLNVTTNTYTGKFMYSNNTLSAGSYTVNVSFYNDDYEYTSAEATFVVNKINTYTEAYLINNTAGNVTVRVIVYDVEGRPVTTGFVNIKNANGKLLERSELNGKNNVDIVIRSITTNDSISLIANYEGSVNYINSTNSTALESFTIDTRKVTITAIPENTTFGNTSVKVNLTDSSTGTALVGAPFNIIDADGNVVGKGTTGSDGTATVKVTVPAGEQTLTVVYPGNSTYKESSQSFVIDVEKLPSKTSATVINNTAGNVTIRSKVTDATTNKVVTNGNVVVLVNNSVVGTGSLDNNGVAVITTNIANEGNYNFITRFEGNNNYTSSNATISNVNVIPKPDVKIEKRPSSINAIMQNNTVGNVVIKATVTDKLNGKSVTSGVVNVLVNGSVVGKVNVNSKGVATIKTNVMEVGNYTFDIKFEGNEKYTSSSTKLKSEIEAKDIKVNVTIENDTVTNTTVVVNVSDPATGKGIPNETVSVKLPNGTTINVRTDKNGIARVETQLPSGSNSLKVSVKAKDEYKSSSTTVKVNVKKIDVKVTVKSVRGTVGETITLKASVVDKYGNKVNGGNIVFKLNGRSLRTDLKFDTNDTEPYKISVKNGVVTVKLTADLYLRAGKNITASYSGTNTFNSAKANVAKAKINKRKAKITFSVTPKITKQDKNLKFSINLTDITPKSKKSLVNKDAYVMFKINGKTLKNSNKKILKVKVVNNTVKYIYRVPLGTSGIKAGKVRNYTVSVVYSNPDFYSCSINKDTYTVKRSATSIVIKSATIKKGKLSVKASILDEYKKFVVGKNKVTIKIDGHTYKVKNKTVKFRVKNGIINLSGIKINSKKIKTLTLVNGERQSYYASSATTKKVKTL